MLYKYQYEILGRISEVCGKYMPHRDDHTILDIEGEEFVMFVAKTAKRKGRLRACARPLSTKYDPWAKEVLDYIESSDGYPFKLHENFATSKTYGMNKARNIFKGYHWPMSDYNRSVKRAYTEDMIRTTRWGDKGYEEFLVIFPDGTPDRGWTKSKEYVNLSEKVEPRWKPVTSHVLRKITSQLLVDNYGLDIVDVARFGGWTVTGQQTGVSASLGKHYLYLDLSESRAAIVQLEKQVHRYAKKLLVPFDVLS